MFDQRLLWLTPETYARIVAEARRRGITPSRLLDEALKATEPRQ